MYSKPGPQGQNTVSHWFRAFQKLLKIINNLNKLLKLFTFGLHYIKMIYSELNKFKNIFLEFIRIIKNNEV